MLDSRTEVEILQAYSGEVCIHAVDPEARAVVVGILADHGVGVSCLDLQIERGEHGCRVGILGHAVPVVAKTPFEVEAHAAQLVHVQAYVQHGGHQLLAVRPSCSTYAVHRPLVAMEGQHIGVTVLGNGIVHRLERIHREQPADSLVYLRGHHLAAVLYLNLAAKILGIFVVHSGETYLLYFYRMLADINRLGRLQLSGGVAHLLFYLRKRSILRHSALISPAHDAVHRFGVEAEHAVARHVRADGHVGMPHVSGVSLAPQHVAHLHHQVQHVVDLGVGEVGIRQHHPYYNIRAHRARHVRRIVVSGAAVYQDHVLVSNGLEEHRDGHGGTHGGVHGAGGPVFGLAGHKVGRHTEEGYGKSGEIQGILVSHRHGGNGVVHVDAVGDARREAVERGGGRRTLHHVLLLGRTQVQSLPPGGCQHPLLHLCLEIFLGVVERQGDEIALLAHLHVVGNVVLVHFVREGLAPVHPAHQGVQLVRGVA